MADGKPLFTYGDRIRRKNGGPVKTVKDVGASAYYFYDGTFALIEDQDCYEIEEKASGYFEVCDSLDGLPIDDHLSHGYELREDFQDALRRLIRLWGGRVGERVGDRNKFLLLRFHDTPGGIPDKAWLPLYMLKPVDIPDYMIEEERDEMEEELDRAFGFD